jgi:hypothetical protein
MIHNIFHLFAQISELCLVENRIKFYTVPFIWLHEKLVREWQKINYSNKTKQKRVIESMNEWMNE